MWALEPPQVRPSSASTTIWTAICSLCRNSKTDRWTFSLHQNYHRLNGIWHESNLFSVQHLTTVKMTIKHWKCQRRHSLNALAAFRLVHSCHTVGHVSIGWFHIKRWPCSNWLSPEMCCHDPRQFNQIFLCHPCRLPSVAIKSDIRMLSVSPFSTIQPRSAPNLDLLFGHHPL